MPNLQRKYIDLIREVSAKWVNLDPSIPIEVGTFGEVEPGGELRIGGNIYHPDFQIELDKLEITLRVADYPPQEGSVEDDHIIASKGAKQLAWHLGPDVGVPGIANASIRGQWQFEQGKRDAILIMHHPRLRFLPHNVILETLYRVPTLKDKWLVTSVHCCPAFSMYLSDKSGEKVSLAFAAQAPVAGVPGITAGAHGGFDWWSDTQAGFFRRASDRAGNYCFTPLYKMKRRIGWWQRVFREDGTPETPPSGDELWCEVAAPWDPLNEDGDEDSLEVQEEEDPNEF